MKKIMLVLILLAIVPAISAECNEYNTPKLFANYTYELSEGEPFHLDMYSSRIKNKTIYTYTPIGTIFPSFTMNSNGNISINPIQEDAGTHKILIIGYAKDCYDSKLITFKVNDKPKILATPEKIEIEAMEGKAIPFKITIEDKDDEAHKINWYVNDELASTNKTYTFFPDYDSSGIYIVKVTVEDSKKLKDEQEWTISVNNVNRPPVLVSDIPSFILLLNQTKNLYNLEDYFRDPDNDKLSFSYREIDYQEEIPLPLVDFELEFDGSIIRATGGFIPGYKYYKWIATDTKGLSTESNNIKLETARDPIYNVLNYCGDSFCSSAETCSTCRKDCGPCDQACRPNWECSGWEACKPSGVQKRDCIDKSSCGYNWKWPPTVQACIYVPTCTDGIKNQDETDIDCGGSCGICPSCDDRKKNFGEEGIDCGGICKPCPSCFDNLKNQDESDVDCGGTCGECAPGKECNNNFDCNSFICLNRYCVEASCNDGIRNQNEEKADCGGVCDPCPTCYDGIKNQKEEKIDCGGPCKNCPTCSDKIQNQEEVLIDCGGPCISCSLTDYIKQAEYKQIFIIFIIVLIISITGIKLFKNSVFYFDLKTSGLFSFLESNKHLGLVIFLNRFKRILRKPVHKDTADEAIASIKEGSKDDIGMALANYFRHTLPLPSDPVYDDIYSGIKNSNYRYLIRVLLIILLKNLGRLRSMVLGEELKRIRKESIEILKELGKSI